MKKSEHFDILEFSCRDKEQTPYPPEWINTRLAPLISALEIIRKKLGSAIYIVSGYRTKKHNKSVGGAKKSLHCEGLAADIKSYAYEARTLYNLIEKLILDGDIPDGGLEKAPTWVHYDLRGLIDMPPARFKP